VNTIPAISRREQTLFGKSCIGTITVADPGFQVRGGGALKKIAPSGGRR
jgi:hypothetical protein